MARSSRARNAGASSTRYQASTLVYVTVPVPVRVRARTVSYVYPRQRQRSRRVIRIPLRMPPMERFRMARIAVRVPRHRPAVAGSYVSIDRSNRLNIHSKKQLRSLMDRYEHNRRRRFERKYTQGHARDGQLDSSRGDRLGIIGEAVRRGLGAAAIGDAAMVSRALGGS